jgi:predicted  nucleic acid-binding Zn-ribbon protein
MLIVAKFVAVVIAGMCLLNFVGLSPRELGEYAGVFATNAEGVIDRHIPQSAKIQRLELLLRKLQGQVTDQQHTVATAKVALEDAEAEFQNQELACTRIRGELQQLRGLTKSDGEACEVTVGYRGISQQDIRRALAARLESWKQADNRREALGKALELRRVAYEKLEASFANWQSRRELLAQQIETLKIRQQTQSLESETDTEVFNDADLARAVELAENVERELRIVEAGKALGMDPLDALVAEPAGDEFATTAAEVDAILAE